MRKGRRGWGWLWERKDRKRRSTGGGEPRSVGGVGSVEGKQAIERKGKHGDHIRMGIMSF